MNQDKSIGLKCLLAEQMNLHEQLLWSSCPSAQHSSAVKAYSVMKKNKAFAIALSSLSVSCICLSLISASATPQSPSAFPASLLFGVIAAFCFGLLMCSGIQPPLWLYEVRANIPLLASLWPISAEKTSFIVPPDPIRLDRCVYGLTSLRVIVVDIGKYPAVRSLWLQEIEHVQCIDSGNGWGDLLLIEGTKRHQSLVRANSSSASKQSTFRLWGIHRIHDIEKALLCLLAHQPVQAAIQALSSQTNALPLLEEVNNTLVSQASTSEKYWQATVWSGQTLKDLNASVVYAPNLVQLRERATSLILSQHPHYFSNTNVLQDERSLALQQQYELYSCSESPSLSQASFPNPVKSQEAPRRATHKRKSAPTGDEVRELHIQGTQDERSSSQERKRQEAIDPFKQIHSCHWMRKSPTSQHPSHVFLNFEEAVHHFVHHDLLASRGPNYIDTMVAQKQFLGIVQTVKVVDTETVANDLLHRGGWHLLQIMGMTAPRGETGPVLFILGHPESQAV